MEKQVFLQGEDFKFGGYLFQGTRTAKVRNYKIMEGKLKDLLQIVQLFPDFVKTDKFYFFYFFFAWSLKESLVVVFDGDLLLALLI